MEDSRNRVDLRIRNGVPIIEISGIVSDAIEEDLIAAYEEACQSQSQNIILKFDLEGHIYSSGINVIIKLIFKAEKNQQKICATGLSKHFVHIFSMTALTKFIQIFPSEEEAVAALQQNSQ